MRLGKKLPLVTAERPMNLAALMEARKICPIKPSWSVIFAKAFSLVSLRQPELRRCYVTYPYPHLYEHSCNAAMVIVEREFEGESFPFTVRIRKPDRSSLCDLHRFLERSRTIPLEEDANFRFMRRIGSAPLPIRRLIWNLGYHWSGSKRARYYGTFGLSSPASAGAGLTTIVSPLTCTIHYGMFDEKGKIDMRITFDHRAIDGAPIARALSDLEVTLQTTILAELQQLSASRDAA